MGADAIQKILHQRDLIKTNLITGNKRGHRPPSSWSWCTLHRPSWPCSSSPCLPPQTSERGRWRTQKGKHSRVSPHPNVSILRFDNRKSRIFSHREFPFKSILSNVIIGVKGWILAIRVLDLCAGVERCKVCLALGLTKLVQHQINKTLFGSVICTFDVVYLDLLH